MQKPTRMDDAAAVEEAKRRWGPDGAISIADQWLHARCLVGELSKGPRFQVYGRGSTWETAFADADARPVNATRRHADRQRGIR